MLELLSIKNMGNKGLNTDVTQWDLPPEFITHGNNYRVLTNAISSAGGWQDWSTAPVLFDPGYLLAVGATSGEFWLVAGRSAVYAFDGSVWSDISSVEGYLSIATDGELLWTGAQIGKIPVINNPFTFPEYWAPVSSGQVLQALPFSATDTWEDKGFRFGVIRAHKNFLFALNLREGVDEIPDGYRWSHPADINGLPFTWDETDTSALAGRAQLGSDGGAIIDGLSLRDSFCIYSENGIDILDFTGDSFVWRRRELSNTIGLLSPQSIVEVNGVHYFLSDGDIMMNDGNAVVSIVHDRIRRRVNSSINSEFYTRAYALRNRALEEVWFCLPTENSEYPNVAYIYNHKNDNWSIRDLPPEASHGAYGAQNDATTVWDAWLGTWDSQSGEWGGQNRTPLNDTLVTINIAESSLKILDPSDGRDSGDLNSVVERTNYPLAGMKQVTSIMRVYPHMIGTQPVNIQFGSHDFAGSPVRWQPPVLFTPETDRKIDIRTTGELHAWRISSVGEGNWIMSGMDIEFSMAGVR